MNIAQQTPILNNQQTGIETGFARNFAFVIGINNYQNGISPLKTAINDAKKLVEVLREKHKYQTWVCLDNVATLSNINQFLEETLPAQVTENDRLLFYFAGHGVALNGDDGPVGYLIPQDAKLGDINSYLPMTKLHDALGQLPCRHFLGILDCCFAGAFRWSSTRDLITSPEVIYQEHYDRFIRDCAWQIITSSASDQKALDNFNLDTERGQVGIHSPFAAALLEALEGAADAYPPAKNGKQSGDGVITATELYLYLRDRVEIPTDKQRLRQTPSIWCLNKHDKGEYIFLDPSHELNLPPAPPLDSSKNPYRGLNSFEEEHSDIFFGRSELVEKLQDFVNINPLAVVLGASGSGKSSLVKAGLIPKLKQETKETNNKWCILPPIRPGETPFQSLNQALVSAGLTTVESHNKQKTLAQSIDIWAKKHPNIKLLIFIDQSEEIITLCQDENQRQEFFQQILTAIHAHGHILRVVLSLRSDFEPQLQSAGLKYVPTVLQLGNTVLKNRWQNRKFQVPMMKREELREAIEKPAQSQVMYFEPHNLVEQLIDEVADMPGALPLLSFALSELFLKYLKRQRDAQYTGQNIERALTQKDYQELGGVMQSLTQRADEEYQALVQKNPACEEVIRHVMLRMVAIGGGELARRRVPLSELEYPPEKNSLVKLVIEQFSQARLLVQGQDAEGNPYVEPAHDALVRSWPKLREWKEQELVNVLLQRELMPIAQKWSKERKNKQSIGLLWDNDPRLPLLKEILKSENNWLNKLETEFVQTSLQREQNNLRRLIGSITGVILTLSGLTVYAFWQQRTAELRRVNAEINTHSLAATNLRTSNLKIEALLENLKATQKLQQLGQYAAPDSRMRAIASLEEAVSTIREYNHLEGHSGQISQIIYSPNGKTIASASLDGTVKLWNIDGKELKTLKRKNSKDIDQKNVKSISFSPDGKMIFAAGEYNYRGYITLWTIDGQELKTLKNDSSSITSASFHPDGKAIVFGTSDTSVKLWNIDTQEIKTLPQNPKGPIGSYSVIVKFSPDGKLIAASDFEGNIDLWANNGRKLRTIKGRNRYQISEIVFSPDSKTIAVAKGGGIIELLSIEGQELWTKKGHKGSAESVSFSPDGRIIASGGQDNNIVLWNRDSGEQLDILRGVTNSLYNIRAVTFSPDGKVIASGGTDNIVTLWRTNKQKLKTFNKGNNAVNSVNFSPDGKMIVSAGDVVNLWSTDGQLKKSFPGHQALYYGSNSSPVSSASFSPDGMTIASTGDDGKVKFWSINGGLLKDFEEKGKGGQKVNFSADGKRFWYLQNGGQLQLRNVNGQLLKTIGEGFFIDVAFSPDNSKIVTTSSSGVTLWTVEGQELRRWEKISDINTVNFSPDSRMIVGGSDAGTVYLFTVDGQLLDTLKGGHSKFITSVSFSPDGGSVLSSSADGTVGLWSIDGQLLRTLRTNKQAISINSASFSPDGQMIAAASNDGKIIIWNFSVEYLQALGCNWLRDYLDNNLTGKQNHNLCV